MLTVDLQAPRIFDAESILVNFFLERASRSALTKYTIKSLVYVSTTNIYLEYTGYMFRPVNRSSSGHQSNKSKVLLTL